MAEENSILREAKIKILQDELEILITEREDINKRINSIKANLRYYGVRIGKWYDNDEHREGLCNIMFGKTYRELTADEKREYDRAIQCERRNKKKGAVEND